MLSKKLKQRKHDIAIEIEVFSDINTADKEKDKDASINMNEPIVNLNQNGKNNQNVPEIKNLYNIYERTKDSSSFVSSIKFNVIDNSKKEAYIIIMYFIQEYFLPDLNFEIGLYICDDFFEAGNNNNCKWALGLKIYQILYIYSENKKRIRKILHKKINKIKDSRRKTFFYFMTRTYKELYYRYIKGDIDFPLFEGGTVRITKFPTQQRVIKEKINDENYVKNKSRAFEEIGKNIFEGKSFDTFEKEEKFEIMRCKFKLDRDWNGMNLEE